LETTQAFERMCHQLLSLPNLKSVDLWVELDDDLEVDDYFSPVLPMDFIYLDRIFTEHDIVFDYDLEDSKYRLTEL
jgi:hypothetical protein